MGIDLFRRLQRVSEGHFVGGYRVTHSNIGGILAQEFFEDKADAQQWLAKAVILAEPGDTFKMEEGESEK